MPPTPPIHRRPLVLVTGALALMVAFGGLVACLPAARVQPVVALSLGCFNLLALALLTQRAFEPGPEQAGWRLLALSMLGVIASNVVLRFSPTPLTGQSTPERLYLGLHAGVSIVQGWAFLRWPFRSQERVSQKVMNLLGSLVFAGSTFLFLWIACLSVELDRGQWPIFFWMLGLAVRVAVVGGAVIYILAEDPRRARGPIGGFFAAVVVVLALLVLLRPLLFDAHAVMQPTPIFGLVLTAPLAFAAAAWLRLPMEVPADAPRLRYPMVDAVLYVPFAASGTLLIRTAVRGREHLVAPLVGFVGISGLLLIRQLYLLREVRRANERLEARVLERTRSLEELQRIILRTERLNSVGVLGAGLTHDLNNALTGLRAYAELVRMRLDVGHPTSPGDLDRILVAADQSTALTGRLMAFARQEEEAREALDLDEEVSQIEHILRMMLTRKTTLRLDLGEQPIRILGSRHQLEQILVNLVGNAKDAMPQGGNITVRAGLDLRAAPPAARLEVSDTGEGMSPEVQAQIFEPFFTTKVSGKGTGLGLASVRYLMESVGGSIQVDSQPGRGSTFTLCFPLIDLPVGGAVPQT